MSGTTLETESSSWLDLLSVTAVITTVFQFLTGVLVSHKFIQKKSTGDSSGFPFVCGFLSCASWLIYGALTNESSVVLVNAIGTFLFFLYIVIYFVFTVNKQTLIRQIGVTWFFLVMALVYTNYEPEKQKAAELMGVMCCFVTVLFFAAPLTMLLHVVRVKNTESLPFPMILASFLVSLQWFVYGILIDDMFIQITNVLGCLLSGAQLSLFLCYTSKSPYTSTAGYRPLDQIASF